VKDYQNNIRCIFSALWKKLKQLIKI
jgi:hypothetical protein